MTMNRTYRNDGSLSAYPFLQSPSLPPFPRSCIRMIGVCVAYPVASVSVVGVALSASSVAVSLVAVSTYDRTEHLCTLSAAPGKYAAASERGRFCAWMMAGVVPDTAYGSYSGDWRLDPSCVTVSPVDGGALTELTVNGAAVALGDVLSIDASGLLSATTALDALDRPVAALLADIPDTVDVLYETSVASDYAKVTSLLSSGTASELTVAVEDASGREQPETADYVTLDIDFRGRDGDEVTMLDPTGEGQVPEDLRARLDTAGEAVLVTLNGHKGLPNCYATDKDEALD